MEVSQEVSSMVRGWLRASPSASRCRLPTTCPLITPRPERLGLGAKPPSEGTPEAFNKSTLTSKIGKKLMKRKRRHDDWEEQEDGRQAELSRAANAENSSDEECSRSTAIVSAKRSAERHPGVTGPLGRKRRKRKKKRAQMEEEAAVSSSSAITDAVLDLNESNQSTEIPGTHVDTVELPSSIKGVLGVRDSIAGKDPSKHGSEIEAAEWAAQEMLPRTKDLLLDGSKKRRLEHVKGKSRRKKHHRKTELEPSLTGRGGRNAAAVMEQTVSLVPALESRSLTELSETDERGARAVGGTGVCHKGKKKPAKAARLQDGRQQHSPDVEVSHDVANSSDVCSNSTQPSTSEPQSTSTESVVASKRSGKSTIGHKMKHSKLLRRHRKLKRQRRAFQENVL